MNLPTILIALVIFGVFAAIVIRGIINRKNHKSGCGCGCDCCQNASACRK